MSPLHVVIGSGSFSGGFSCFTSETVAKGYVTYSGAGIGNSVVQSVVNDKCTNLTTRT